LLLALLLTLPVSLFSTVCMECRCCLRPPTQTTAATGGKPEGDRETPATTCVPLHWRKNRMEALFPALSSSRAELRQIARLIEDAVNALVTDVNVVAYDELTDDYHPSSVSKAKHEAAGDTIPVGVLVSQTTPKRSGNAPWCHSSRTIRSAPANCSRSSSTLHCTCHLVTLCITRRDERLYQEVGNTTPRTTATVGR
jgi:hypothetical protein